MKAIEDKDSSSICDTCIEPGACCKKLVLHVNGRPLLYDKENWIEDAKKKMADRGYSFLTPIEKEDHPVFRDNVIVKFSCQLLGEDGRCNDYANRPGFCRSYTPGVEELCVMYKPIDRIERMAAQSKFHNIPIVAG